MLLGILLRVNQKPDVANLGDRLRVFRKFGAYTPKFVASALRKHAVATLGNSIQVLPGNSLRVLCWSSLHVLSGNLYRLPNCSWGGVDKKGLHINSNNFRISFYQSAEQRHEPSWSPSLKGFALTLSRDLDVEGNFMCPANAALSIQHHVLIEIRIIRPGHVP